MAINLIHLRLLFYCHWGKKEKGHVYIQLLEQERMGEKFGEIDN